MERLIYNEWTVSGEVVYIKVLEDNEFAGSIRLKGSAKRKGASSSQVMEFSCLLEKSTYDEAIRKGLTNFKYVTLGGHIETWIRQTKNGDRQKTRFVCDDILEVC
jgi:hypothetical protein